MPGFEEFSQRFHDLIGKTDSADVRVPEDSALIGLAADLVPTISGLLADGIALLSDVEAHYGLPPGAVEIPDTLSQIGVQISLEYAARDLNDVAFFARTDLRSAFDNLTAAAAHRDNLMALATQCESGLRRVRKALVSVESAIHEFEGQPPPERSWFDVEISLQIRKLYWNLRRETAGDDPRPLEQRLRSVLYRIVAFRELSIYPLLRVEDRITLRQLLKRILEWLNGDQRDPGIGGKLWQDLSAFADILVHVSLRQELMEHDLALVSKAYRTLFPYGTATARRTPGTPPATVPGTLVGELQSLLGLDDELDRLILQGSDGKVADWRKPLRRLQTSLSRTSLPTDRLDLL